MRIDDVGGTSYLESVRHTSDIIRRYKRCVYDANPPGRGIRQWRKLELQLVPKGIDRDIAYVVERMVVESDGEGVRVRALVWLVEQSSMPLDARVF